MMMGLVSGAAAVAGGAVVMSIDVDGFLLSTEFLSLIAGVFTVFFSGLANSFLTGLFNN